MVIKNLLCWVLALNSLFVLESCNKHCSSITAGNPISLSGGYTLYSPIKDSINVGDTIFINVTVPEKLIGNTNNSPTDFSNANNMIPDISFSSLKGMQLETGALDSFILIKQVGSFSVNSLLPKFSISVTFSEQGGNYFFSLGCKAQKRGVYLITVSDIPDASKKCTHAAISIISKSSDSHLHYLTDIYYGGGAIAQIDSTHSYCFKVY